MNEQPQMVALPPSTPLRSEDRRLAGSLAPWVILLTIGLIPTSPLLAQRAPVRAASDTIDVVQLDSLVVSVLRTPVELGTMPFAISVVGQQELGGAKALVSIEELLEGVPGLQVQDRYNDAVGERISIRGFGSRSQFGVRGIKVFVDDIPATLADGQSTLDHLELGSLGRVEVLRGPASMLYGGAAGGVLRFSTQQPARARVRQSVRLSGGSFGFWKLNSITSGTANATGYVASLGVTRRDGFRTHPLDSTNPPYGASEKLQFNSRLTHSLAGGDLSLTLNVLDLAAENAGSLSDSLLALGDAQAFRFNVIQGARKDITQAQLGARWNRELGGGELELATYGVRRSLDNPIPNTVIDLTRNAGGVRALYRRAEAIGEAPDGITWTTGVELDLQSDARLNFDNDGGDRGPLTLDQHESVRALGTFGNVIIRPGDRLTIAGGIRYDRVGFEAQDNFVTAGEPDDSGTRTMDSFSPSAGIHARLSDGAGLFANISTAFLTPTTTELANRPEGSGGLNPDLESSTSRSIEAGLRGKFGARGAYEFAAFRTTVEGELVPFEVASDPGRTFFRNSGKSVYDGFEAMLMTRPTRGFLGRVTYSYVDARFEDYRVGDDDFSGNAVPGSAPHRVETLMRFTGRQAFLEAHTRTVSSVPVDDAGRFEADGYTTLDLRLALTPLRPGFGGMRFEPFVSVRNVLDNAYVTSVVVNAFGSRFFEPAPGRTFQVGASAAWVR